MKRIRWTAILMAAALLLGGCSGTAENSGTGSTLEVRLEHSYASERIASDAAGMLEMQQLGGRILLTSYGENRMSPAFYFYKPEAGSISPAALQYYDAHDRFDGTREEGKRYVGVSAMMTDADGRVHVLYQSYLLDEDWNRTDSACYREIYDSSMTLLEGGEIAVDMAESDEITCMAADDSGCFYALISNTRTGDQRIGVFDEAFHATGEVTGNIQWVEQLFRGGDGEVYLFYYTLDGKPAVGRMDGAAGILEEITPEGMPDYASGSLAGSGIYDFYLYDTEGLYGVQADEESCEKVVDWVNFDFMGEYVNSAAALENGQFLVNISDMEHTDAETWLLTERSPEDLQNVELISLACFYASPLLTNAVNLYNRTHDSHRIVMMNYGRYNTESDRELGRKQFEKDMTSGIVADIICTDGLSFESYANKGIFADLYECMEADESFAPEDYYTNYFSALEYRGSLYRIGVDFRINTLAAKTALAGEQSGISVGELTEKMVQLPEGTVPFMDMSRESALNYIVLYNLGSFIDAGESVCEFNTPAFVELLEFCNTYPSEAERMAEQGDMTPEEVYAREYAYRNNEVLFYTASLDSCSTYHALLMAQFGTEDVTLVGYPVIDDCGNGGVFCSDFTIAMSSQTKYRNEVWAFMKYMLSEEFQERLEGAFPVNRYTMEKQMQEAMQPETYVDENGETQILPSVVYFGGEDLEIGEPTQQEMDALAAYIEGVTVFDYSNKAVFDILYEESFMYFAGDQTAEEAAEKIQSRVSIYLSEQQ